MNIKIYVVNLDKRQAILDELNNRQIIAEPSETLSPWEIDEQCGAWINLPINQNDLGKCVQEAVGSAHEYEITKTDSDLTELAFDDESIFEVNNIAQEIDDMELTYDQIRIINALMYENGLEVEEAYDYVDDWDIIDGIYEVEELGSELYANENGCAVDYDLADYVDWERYVEDHVSDYIIYDDYAIIKG